MLNNFNFQMLNNAEFFSKYYLFYYLRIFSFFMRIITCQYYGGFLSFFLVHWHALKKKKKDLCLNNITPPISVPKFF